MDSAAAGAFLLAHKARLVHPSARRGTRSGALAPRPRARALRWQSLALADPYLLFWASSYRWQSLALAEPGATYDATTGWALNG